MTFNDDHLYKLAGSDSYQKAEHIVLSGAVNDVVFVEHGVQAKVTGTSTYSTSLYANDKVAEIVGNCTCPAAEYQRLCKHCVALGIYVNRLNSDEEESAVNEMEKLKAWLGEKPHDELLEILWKQLSENANERQKWLFKMNASQDNVSSDKLKRLIRLALPEESLWDYRDVFDYFSDAEEKFAVIYEGIDCLEPEKQWELSLYALEILATVLEEIDDSYGHRFDIEGRLTQNLYDLFDELDWSVDQKAGWLLEHTMNCGHDLFPSVPGQFKFSAVVEKQYLALCLQEIERQVHENKASVDFSILWPLIEQAKQKKDWREECRLKLIKANQFRDWLELSEICLENGDELEADHWLIKAKQVAKFDREQRNCIKQEIEISIVLDDHTKAWKLGWSLFDTEPSFTQYKELQKLYLRLETQYCDSDYLTKVEQQLIEHYVKHDLKKVSSFYGRSSHDSILEFYLDKQEVDKARSWVKGHQANKENLLKLADLVVTSHPIEAIELYHRSLRPLISETNNGAYAHATDLLKKLKGKMAVKDHALFQKLISELQAEFKLKRNMMKLLKENFC